jgi:hypothetical protein
VVVVAVKVLPLYQALQVLLNGVGALVVGVGPPHQLATEVVADQFLVEVAVVVVGQLLRLYLGVALAEALQLT